MDPLHVGVYFLLTVVFVARAFRLPASFHSLIGLHRVTQYAGFASSALLAGTFCARGLSADDTLVLVLDSGVMISSVIFLIGLAVDVNAALRALQLAFKEMRVEFGADSDRIIALVIQALRRGR